MMEPNDQVDLKSKKKGMRMHNLVDDREIQPRLPEWTTRESSQRFYSRKRATKSHEAPARSGSGIL